MRYFRDTGILFLGGILPLCTLSLNRGLVRTGNARDSDINMWQLLL